MTKLAKIEFIGKEKGFFSPEVQSALDNALEQANAYLAKHDLDIVTIETITREHPPTWAQGVRIWYRAKEVWRQVTATAFDEE